VGEVTRREGSVVFVLCVDSGNAFTLDLDELDIPLLLYNENVVDDMTELQHIHLPAILHNLEERSISDKPYTFLGGSVLVSVNPLRPVREPAITKLIGTKGVVNLPHPYAIAERAYQQLLFASKRGGSILKSGQIDQSIVVSGESGAGKTESAKMVLRHLVRRCVESVSGEQQQHLALDQRLLDSNPITEAFGNAATKRNHNSSRFGKFLIMHFDIGGTALRLQSASVETYLLERSRVVSHELGERNYHVFYQLVAGASKRQRSAWGLKSSYEYTYLMPKKRESSSKRRSDGRTKRDISVRRSLRLLESKDGDHFETLCDSLATIGLPRDASDEDAGNPDACDQNQLFAAIAALLHLGNVEFENDDSGTGGSVGVILDTVPLKKAAELLGVESSALERLFTERKLKTAGEEIIARRDALDAKMALDSVVKSIYQKLFD
jgi:myosin heavy subunit